MTERERLIERIKKLLALAESSNPNEAENAMLQAQRLMAEHGIRQNEVAGSVEKRAENITETRTDIGCKKCGWKVSLADVIASNFRCEALTVAPNRAFRHERRIVFIGEEADVEIATAIFSFAVKTAQMRCDEHILHCRKRATAWGGRPLTRNECALKREAFLYAFPKGLDARFDEQKKHHKEWGLVLQKPGAIKEYFKEKYNRDYGDFGTYKCRRAALDDSTIEDVRKGYRHGYNFDPQARVLG